MDFDLTEEQKMIAASARQMAADFPPAYWREKDAREEFAGEFYRALSRVGFTGLIIPERYGGVGKGLTELLIAMEELAASGSGLGGAWYLILTEVFGALTILRHGTEEQRAKYLPGIASGDIEFCMALTEPDAGSNTFNTRTTASKVGGGADSVRHPDLSRGWLINGAKTFISGADRARGMLIVARTAKEKAPRTSAISLFLADLPNASVRVAPIAKHGVNYSHSCDVEISNLELPDDALMPPLNEGWRSLVDTLNAERMSFAAAAIGTARLAMNKAVEYSKGRKVFGDEPIGSYQGLQFPLAEAYAGMEAARLLNLKASTLFDRGANAAEVGATANLAKVTAIESSHKAIYWSMQVFGGLGYARDTDVERWWREVNLLRLAPITQQMALAHIAEHVLGMPKSHRHA